MKSSFGAVVFNRTGGISFNKSRSHGTNYVVMDGNLYREMERNDLSDDAREGTIFGYRIDISQRNNGSQPSGLASGGITNSVIEVVDKELDDRLYFRRVMNRPGFCS